MKPSNEAHVLRSLGLIDAVSMVVGIILGSGIFVAPAAVAQLTGNPVLAVGLWAAGAIVAGFGALCYAECGARLPEDGGFFVFFSRAFGWKWAFVAGWAALLVSYPTSLAGVAAMGAQYFGAAVPGWAGYERSFAVAAVLWAALLNAWGLRLGRFAQRAMTLSKLLAIISVLAAALWLTWRGEVSLPTNEGARAPGVATTLGAALVLQVLATLMWTYDGWTDITMVAGEVREPAKNLPRAVLLSLLVLLAVYALVQVAVMALLGPVAAGSDQVLALALGRAFGARSEQILAWLVLLTTLGSIHGLMFATSRLALAMAERRAVFAWFAKLDGADCIPRRAIAGVWALSTAYVLAGSFAELLEVFSLVIWLFYGATAVALLRLRKAGVGHGIEGFGLNGHLAPFVLILAACTMTALQLAEHAWRSLAVLAVLLMARAALSSQTAEREFMGQRC